MVEKIKVTIQKQPVKVGEVIRASIFGFGKKGNPFVKFNGLVIYIKNFENKKLVLRKMISLRIIKVCTKFAFADIIKEDNSKGEKDGRA